MNERKKEMTNGKTNLDINIKLKIEKFFQDE